MKETYGTRRAARSLLVLTIGLFGVFTLRPASAATNPSSRVQAAATTPLNWNTTATGLVSSTAERLTNISIGRDGGYSTPLDTKRSFWIFGDTMVRTLEPVSKVLLFSPGSSTAIGPTSATQLPTDLREVIPNVGIAPLLSKPITPAFLPKPKVAYLAGTKNFCSPAAGRFAARWPSGATRLPGSPNILITFVDACVNSPQSTVEGFGVAIWSSKTFKFVLPATDLVAPTAPGRQLNWATVWTSPIAQANGSVDFFSTADDPTQPGTSLLRVAHVAKGASLIKLASYVSQPLPGPLNGSFPGRLLHVAAYPGQQPGTMTYRAIGSQFSLGTARISSAPSLTGPWSDDGSAALPDCPRPQGTYCWSLIGHPELSTSSSLVVSYYAPGTVRDYGHVRLARLTPTTSAPTPTP